MSRFPSGHVLPPLVKSVESLPAVSLMLISLTFILAEKVGLPFCMLNAGEHLGPEKHEISDGKRRHHETKAPYLHVADGRTELRSARLFCCLDELAVFLFSHCVLAACSTITLIGPRGQRVMLGDVPKPSAGAQSYRPPTLWRIMRQAHLTLWLPQARLSGDRCHGRNP
jgi:hypothetical protein